MASDESRDIFDKIERQNTLEQNKKSSWKDRLKGKIFTHKHSSEDSAPGRDPVASLRVDVTTSTQNDVRQFLNPFGRSGSPPLQQKDVGPKLSLAPPQGQDGINEIFQYHRPRRKEGLHVGFIETPPEIIGHGGDETTDPVVSISRSSKPTHSDSRAQLPPPATATNIHHSLPEQPGEEEEEDSMLTKPLKRIPTGLHHVASTDYTERLSAESERHQEFLPDSSQHHSPAATASDDVMYPFRKSSRPLQTVDIQPKTTTYAPSTMVNQGNGPAAHSVSHQKESGLQRLHHTLQQPSGNGSHLAPPDRDGRQGSSPSPARRPISPNRNSFEDDRPTSQSSRESNNGHYIISPISPLSPIDPASSYLSISSKFSDKDASLIQSQTSAAKKESSPSYSKPELIQSSTGEQAEPSQGYVPYKPSLVSGDSANGEAVTITNEDPPLDMSVSKEAAFQEFVRRIYHTRQIFELILQRDTASRQPSPSSILRAALYWFIMGRLGLEEYVRDFRGPAAHDVNQLEGSPHAVQRILQNQVDLAKAWWLSTQLGEKSEHSQYPQQSQTPIDSGTQQGLVFLTSHFQNLSKSMAKRNLLPPEDLLVKGAQTSLWLKYPTFPSQIGWILQNSAGGQAAENSSSIIHPLLALPLGHTSSTSCFHSCPTECRVFSAAEEEGALAYDTNPNELTFSCLAFILRKSSDREISMRISSLSHQVNVLVREGNQYGPSWEHVRWDERESALRIKLPNRFRIGAKFRRQDFERIATQFQTASQTVSSVASPQDSSHLPAGPYQQASFQAHPDPASIRRPSDVSLASSGAPNSSLESLPRPLPRSSSTQAKVNKVEYLSADAHPVNRVQLFRIEETIAELLQPDDPSLSADTDGSSACIKLKAYGYTFLDQIYSADTVCSFYVGEDTQSGTFSIQLLRPYSLKFDAEKDASSSNPDAIFLKLLQDFQEKVGHSWVISRWVFSSMNELHDFQHLAVGTSVQFDGVAKAFSMSRRLPMVPVSKTYESNEVRLQIVQYKSAVQLLCFFSKYSLARVLQFPLKSSDIIELFGAKGKEHGVKMVDAKFDLPGDDVRKSVEGGFINMECELPIDHEDVLIEFESDTERDRFVAALPAQATASRKFTLRRRI